jgi:ligand-binding SRPBCC domain-containing protein
MEHITSQGIRWTVDPAADSLPGGYRVLRAEALIPLPRDEVFPFFAAAENLERITPPELRFRIITPLPVEMRQGTLIDYRLSLDGIPFGWRTEISEWDPPHAFTDTQLEGPYHTWIHRHTFEEADGGTLMRDEVRWRVPFWPLSAVALPLVRVARIFRHRQEALGALLLT